MDSSSTINQNRTILNASENATLDLLLEVGQGHLISSWPAPGVDDDGKHRLLLQAKTLDEKYPGGLKTYVSNAKRLLEKSRVGANPFEGCNPSVPKGERLKVGTSQFREFEKLGKSVIADICFVLVAGGLGERLGYNGIKIELPIDITTNDCYLGRYCQHILSLQALARSLSQTNEKVPAIVDNEGKFTVTSEDSFEIATKPHGHGDVHMVLHTSGVAKKWVNEGRKWVLFFQDTNGLVFHSALAAIGVRFIFFQFQFNFFFVRNFVPNDFFLKYF
eukprot:GSMAST32.ASY1.ANO1.602.1 assembled CDS